MKEKKGHLKRKNSKSESSTPSDKLVVLLHMKGLSETTARKLKKYNRTVSFRLVNTIGQQLFSSSISWTKLTLSKCWMQSTRRAIRTVTSAI